MIRRLIEISAGPARLSVKHRQLVIERPDKPPVRVPCEDVGVLLVDHPAVSYTHAVLTALMEAGAAVVVCGNNHVPAGTLLPLAGNVLHSERFRLQLNAKAPLKKQLWRNLVQGKLTMQGLVLREIRGDDAGIPALARRVRSGDPDNREAQGAQRYWRLLFGADFRRSREGPPPNPMLNYGYMVLRAAVARALCGAGLHPAMGLHHTHRNNPFCLADDVLEPYRPLADLRVHSLVRAGQHEDSLERAQKKVLLEVFNDIVPIRGQHTPLLLALHLTASSLVRALSEGEPGELSLPEGLPEPVDGEDIDDGLSDGVENGVGIRDV